MGQIQWSNTKMGHKGSLMGWSIRCRRETEGAKVVQFQKRQIQEVLIKVYKHLMGSESKEDGDSSSMYEVIRLKEMDTN